MDEDDFEEAKEYALSDKDIQDLLPVDTNIFTYPHLEGVEHIDEVFDPHGRAIMLFLTESDNVGHWIALIRRGSVVEVFDPYGHKPKEWKTKLGGSKEDNERWGQDHPTLGRKIREAGYVMKVNTKQHQPISPNINTCGRHSAMRLLFAKHPLEKYNKLLKKIEKETGLTADELATALTMETLGK